MALVITYREGWKQARVLKGKLHNGRPCQWHVTVGFTHSGGSHELSFRSPQRCQLTELGELIADRLEGKVFGALSNIYWTATHWR